MNHKPLRSVLAGLVLLAPCLVWGAKLKIKKIKARDNPAEFVSFSRPLSKDDRLYHALDRLTFGPRPGDLAQIKRFGLDKWINLQLHPEKVPENPLLEQRLSPLESLRLSIRDTFTHYPPPRAIAAVARGSAPLPDDPELRATLVRLADKYLQKKAAAAGTPARDGQTTQRGQLARNPDDESDLEPKVKIAAILTPEQIATLKTGKPEEKRKVLESIPAERRLDFAWALRAPERRQLLAFSPVELRRDLMLTISPENVVAGDLSEGKLMRAVYSSHQLQELLVDFWFNRFNVFLNKGSDRYTLPTYEREAIRPHVFGKFYDLLLATSKSPAMLFYLDNWQSVGPDKLGPDGTVRRFPAKGKGKSKRGLNENYGRELLELHTLGVDGGYTQEDVINVARCFTGWTIAAPLKGGGFEYNDKVHDHGEKIVLGYKIPVGGGMNDGVKVLEILSHHPSTAHFVSLRLAQRFVADIPPPSLVNRMTETFLNSDGDLRQVIETMLSSGEFWSQGAYHAKMKSPFEMVVSALRGTGANVTSAFQLANEMQKLGEPLYRKIEPTGYSSANAEWIGSAALLDRMNFSLALAQNRILGVKVDVAAWEALSSKNPMAVARQILERDPSAQTRTAIEKTLASPDWQGQARRQAQLASVVAGLTLGSPEFQKR
ncbi:MAG TPA: DUF1800 domain-containing protein [Bryobacteraceae bacterium]|nr:DUF1800 domain-containing protein [Bryobacteraceae bacterium]